MNLSLPLLFIAAVAACLLPVPVSSQSPLVGIVKTAEGTRSIERRNDSIPANVGTKLVLGDKIVTSSDGSVGVALEDGTILSIGNNTVFEISRFSFAPSRGLFEFLGRLLQGKLVYESGLIEKSAPDRVKIETPYTTIGTRGTRFALSVPAGSSR